MLQRPHAAHPRVVIDAAQIHQEQECCAILPNHVPDAVRHSRAQPFGEAFGHLLLKEKVRVELKRLIQKTTGRRPMIMPIILEI